jgi:hypothetical protein
VQGRSLWKEVKESDSFGKQTLYVPKQDMTTNRELSVSIRLGDFMN